MGMGVVDTIMAGQVGALELAGVALGGAVLWPTLMLFSGVVMSMIPMIAQLNGAGKDSQVAEIARQGSLGCAGIGHFADGCAKECGPGLSGVGH